MFCEDGKKKLESTIQSNFELFWFLLERVRVRDGCHWLQVLSTLLLINRANLNSIYFSVSIPFVLPSNGMTSYWTSFAIRSLFLLPLKSSSFSDSAYFHRQCQMGVLHLLGFCERKHKAFFTSACLFCDSGSLRIPSSFIFYVYPIRAKLDISLLFYCLFAVKRQICERKKWREREKAQCIVCSIVIKWSNKGKTIISIYWDISRAVFSANIKRLQVKWMELLGGFMFTIIFSLSFFSPPFMMLIIMFYIFRCPWKRTKAKRPCFIIHAT